ncbi:MAG: cell division protein FtsW [Clostridia bacterium]|nr:cell division protein FtsW [Clostridia bacterium]
MLAKRTNSSVEKVQQPKKNTKVNSIVRMVGEVDRPMLIVVIALVCLGSIMVFSSSYAVGEIRFGDSFHFARKQIFYVGVGLVVLAACTRLSYLVLKRAAYIIYVIVLGINYLVPFIGESRNGATRWINFLSMEFQPSELLKFALVLAMATYISNHYNEMRTFKKGILPMMLLLAPACLATLLQSHMSATIILFVLAIIMLWLSGIKSFYFGFVLGAVGALGTFFLTIGKKWLFALVPQVETRMKIWEDPFAYMSYASGGQGWQPAQSLYAISSGGFWGLGLGQSNQKHGYLPEPYNDYIFAILAEELGFFGVVAVIALFGILVYRGYRISQNSTNRFCSLLAMGITSQIVVQVIFNLAVVTNTMPSTGISLPFFSYGGTSLVILLAQMGIVLSISRYSLVEQG